MSTIAEVNAAEQRMNEARDALHACLARPLAVPVDMTERNRLINELREATNNYLLLLVDLVPG